MDLTSHTAADGTQIRLTTTEWHLPEILARNPGKLVTQTPPCSPRETSTTPSPSGTPSTSSAYTDLNGIPAAAAAGQRWV